MVEAASAAAEGSVAAALFAVEALSAEEGDPFLHPLQPATARAPMHLRHVPGMDSPRGPETAIPGPTATLQAGASTSGIHLQRAPVWLMANGTLLAAQRRDGEPLALPRKLEL